ncbi:MAG TPA: hypothetical protein VFT99_15695 [Roseiflexaceae bacterium]|nr:hypothetical protein [Roseiflexaceae bacterium]
MTHTRLLGRIVARLLLIGSLVIGWACLPTTPAHAASSGLLISEFLANPPGSDSPFEYVELVATQSIDFSTTPYSVVFADNGTASADGWIAGGTVTYGFSITSGAVARGDVVYVGGSAMVPTGPKLRVIDTSTAPGDRFGIPELTGVLGNGGLNADGIAVFAADIGSLTANSIPVDALFFGEATGSTVTASGGYELPVNDHYNGGKLQADSFLVPDPGSGQVVVATGAYDTASGGFSTPRTWSIDVATDQSSSILVSGNSPVLAACPETVLSEVGSAQMVPVQASDNDGVVGVPQLSSGGVAGITLQDATAAGAPGQAAGATLAIAGTLEAGTYDVGITFSNGDVPPQTAQCTVRVRILATVNTAWLPLVVSPR